MPLEEFLIKRTDGVVPGVEYPPAHFYNHPDPTSLTKIDGQPPWVPFPKPTEPWQRLMRYAAEGNIEFVRKAVEDGADVNASMPGDLRRPLHYASNNGQLEVVRFLVEKGADVHARRNDGRPPLHFAAESGFPEIVRFLLASGADANALDQWHCSAFQAAKTDEIREILSAAMAKGLLAIAAPAADPDSGAAGKDKGVTPRRVPPVAVEDAKMASEADMGDDKLPLSAKGKKRGKKVRA